MKKETTNIITTGKGLDIETLFDMFMQMESESDQEGEGQDPEYYEN